MADAQADGLASVPATQGPDAIAELRALLRDGHGVVRSAEFGTLMVLDEHAAERLLTSPDAAGPVAMPVLEHLSGVTSGPLHELWSVLMFGKDGEDHDRIRRAVAQHFTPAAVERLRPVAERIATELLDEAASVGGEVDLWDAYALPLAARVQATLLGIPAEDLSRVVPWSLALVEAFGGLDADRLAAATSAAEQFTGYLDGLLSAPDAHDAAVIDRTVIDTARADTTLTYEERRGLVANLMFGGLDATAKALTTAVWTLLEHPEQWAHAASGCPVGHVVAEVLRLRPPVPGVGRVTLAPVDLGPVTAGAGELLFVMTVGPATDPQRYADPERFDITRTPGKQFAFGAGPHYCIGANLAKLVLGVGVSALLARSPRRGTTRAARWEDGTFSGFVSLPVVLESGTVPADANLATPNV